MLPFLVKEIENKIDADVEIGKIEARFFKRLLIYDLYIEDFNGDTLIACKQATIRIRRVNLDRKNIFINDVFFDKAYFYFKETDEKGLNFKYFLSRLKKEERKSDPWMISVRNFSMKDSRFVHYSTVKDKKKNSRNEMVNFTDLYFNKLNLHAEKFVIEKGKLSFDIKDMSFSDKSGFKFQHFISQAEISNSGIVFSNPYIETDHSIIIGEKIGLLTDNLQDFKNQGIKDKVLLDIKLESSNISFKDLAYFSAGINDHDLSFIFSGDLKGSINSLSGKDVSVKFGQNSSLSCNVYFNGLPGIEQTYVYADINQLFLNYEDINNLNIPGRNSSESLPNMLNQVGNINYSGNFTGFFKDFFSYGTITSQLGIIKTDLSLKPDTSKVLTLKGKVECEDFHAGQLLSVEKLYKTSFKSEINGRLTKDSGFVAVLSGNIDHMIYDNYRYENIKLNSKFKGPDITGNVVIGDPNLKAVIACEFSNLKEKPEINIATSLDYVNLNKLNLTDSLYEMSLICETEFSGKWLDEIEGFISLGDIQIIKTNDTLSLDTVKLQISNLLPGIEKNISLTSELIDAQISGSYSLKSVIPSFKNIIYNYVKSIDYRNDSASVELDSNRFEYWADVKKVKNILSFLNPEISISENTYLQGLYDARKDVYDFNLVSPFVAYQDFLIKGIQCNSRSDDSLLSVNTGCEYIMFDQFKFENLSIYTDFSNDQVKMKFIWNNWDSVLYKGEINAKAQFSRNQYTDNKKINISIEPSKFIVHDTIWHLEKSKINIDSSYIGLNNIRIYNKKQSVFLRGAVSEQATDTLYISFYNFKLGNLNLILADKNTDINGILEGEISVSDFYKDRFFISKIQAKNLKINQIKFDNLISESKWDKSKEVIRFNLLSSYDEEIPFKIDGYVEPASKKIDAEIVMDNFSLKFFQPYLSSVTSHIEGVGSGKLKISGTTREPVLNGKINLQRSEMDIDYLGTRYFFTDEVIVKNNEFLIDELRLYDKFGNQAIMNGSVKNRYLKNFSLDLKIETDKFLFMDINALNNPDFFGTAIASGYINMSGPLNSLRFDIRVRTEANTEFNVPLTTGTSVGEFSFIDYYPKVKKSEDELYILQQERQNKKSNNLKLNIDMEVTPDAQVQLIFDSKLGDIIKGRGKGNMKMEVNSSGNFRMYGNIEVTEGDYLFTKNVFNKKFKIKEGGTISWNGDPAEAILDIQAIYSLRTSIQPLFEAYTTSANDQRYKKDLPVECLLLLEGNLANPSTKFAINFPTASEEIKGMVNSILSTEDELSNQFISLMILKQFVPPSGENPLPIDLANNSDAIKAGTVELVSNQLSHLLSQVNEDLNIYIDYYEDPERSRKELELMFQYQLLKNKVTINGEIDVPTQQGTTSAQNENSNNMIGDFDVDVKITDNGKLRFKAYNREHDEVTDLEPYYTQGMGFFFREEFNTFGELMRNYYNKITFWRKKEGKKDQEDINLDQ